MDAEIQQRPPVRVFKVGDYDWYAGSCTEQEILDYAMEATGCTHDDLIGSEDMPRELTDEELDKLMFGNDDGTKHSFRVELERMIVGGVTFPCFFASTEV